MKIKIHKVTLEGFKGLVYLIIGTVLCYIYQNDKLLYHLSFGLVAYSAGKLITALNLTGIKDKDLI